MKRLTKVYLLHFIYEFEDGHEDVILLGVFSSKNEARTALMGLKNKFKSKFLQKQFIIDENKVDRLSWEEGFVTLD